MAIPTWWLVWRFFMVGKLWNQTQQQSGPRHFVCDVICCLHLEWYHVSTLNLFYLIKSVRWKVKIQTASWLHCMDNYQLSSFCSAQTPGYVLTLCVLLLEIPLAWDYMLGICAFCLISRQLSTIMPPHDDYDVSVWLHILNTLIPGHLKNPPPGFCFLVHGEASFILCIRHEGSN